jgi:hypothetical protein
MRPDPIFAVVVVAGLVDWRKIFAWRVAVEGRKAQADQSAIVRIKPQYATGAQKPPLIYTN